MESPKKTHAESTPIAKQLASLMREHNLNATELARRTGVPQPTIHRLLHTDNTDPRISTLATLAAYFNVATDYFLGNFASHALHSTHAIPIYNLAELCYPIDKLPHAEQTIILSSLNSNCFAIRSTPSMAPKVPTRSLVVIDPKPAAQDGDLVLVYYQQKQLFSLQDLLQDGSRQVLRSPNSTLTEDLNPASMTIVGTAIQITTML